MTELVRLLRLKKQAQDNLNLIFLTAATYVAAVFYINLNKPITFPRIVTSFTKIGSIKSFSGCNL